MSTYYLGLGANLGDRAGALGWAVGRLRAQGVVVDAVSALYETAPQGVEDQPQFLNAACRVESPLDPPGMLALAKRLEAEAGRVDGQRWGPRPLDIDILAWDGPPVTVHDPALVIPHPRLFERRFALAPLRDVASDLVIADGTSVAAALAAIPPESQPVREVGGDWAGSGL